MTRRYTVLSLAILLAALLMIAAGCSTESDLGGVRVPNSRPDTDITGQPPSLLEAGFVCQFNWKGYDVDGKIVGFQWKISNNGTDGISPRDTMTVDPISGAVVNPWRYTTANDSTFYVLADQPGFPNDPPGDPRSFRTHTIFIRAVDDKGAVDPSPAQMSFTSTTLLPECRVEFGENLISRNSLNAKSIPRTLNVGWSGNDEDFELDMPVRARYLWVEAREPDSGDPIQLRTVYNEYRDELIDFYDPRWSEWIEYSDKPEERLTQFANLVDQETWLFAVQVQDTAGAVSIGKNYQREVANFKVSSTSYVPTVTLDEVYLGRAVNNSPKDQLAAGQPLNFSWSANASSYAGNIVSYQHGWNVGDTGVVTDPGWAIGPGLSEQNRYAEERSFSSGGLNYFYLKVVDDSGTEVLYKWTLDVIPFVAYDDQLPLLVIDQVIDDNSGAWTDQQGIARDHSDYRNAYWNFLDDQVADFNWTDHFVEQDESLQLEYADIVHYRALLVYAYHHQDQYYLGNFRPVADIDRFVSLTPYQRQGGNLFLVGARSLDSLLENKGNYWTPIVFDTREAMVDGYFTSFGTKELPDGTEVDRGPLMYHYETAGIAALDWSATGNKYIYGRDTKAGQDRKPECVGIKRLYLDPAFKSQHLIGPGVLADTIATNPIIDWRDDIARQDGTLSLTSSRFVWTEDEFVDANISGTRLTPVIRQECENAPNNLCVEPMYRGISRFDWLREIRWSEGEASWPLSEYEAGELREDICGFFALASLDTLELSTARTNGRTFGWMSYKMVEDKESGKPDVYWGFDPYRFDEEDTQDAILWVLEYFGLDLE